VDEKDQNALDERGSIFPTHPSTGGSADTLERTNSMASVDGQINTLSASDKVEDAVLVPAWSKFADLSVEQKFEQAKLMTFEERDAYLRERCRAAKIEVAHATSFLNLATAIIETNLPFFLVHFEDMDAQGKRSDLKGKVVGKTEWLRQNMPDISKGTFYAALNSIRQRYAEAERLILGGEVPQASSGRAHLTETQSEVVQALVAQGYKPKDAVAMVMAAEGSDFESLFKSAIPHRDPDIHLVESAGVQDEEAEGTGDHDARDSGEPEDVTKEPNSSPATDATEPPASESVTTVTHADENPPVLRDTAADQLRDALANEPDRGRASELLTEHLQDYASQFANDHIQILKVSATVEFAGRDHRIMPGDFLEEREPNLPPTLCKCTGVAEFMLRRRVRDWEGGKWGKEHVVFSQHEEDYRVVNEENARRIEPGAFPPVTTIPTPEPPVGL
jgi:hypothetical protein